MDSSPFLCFAWALLSFPNSQEYLVSFISIKPVYFNIGSIFDGSIKEQHQSKYVCSHMRITSNVFLVTAEYPATSNMLLSEVAMRYVERNYYKSDKNLI